MITRCAGNLHEIERHWRVAFWQYPACPWFVDDHFVADGGECEGLDNVVDLLWKVLETCTEEGGRSACHGLD